MRIPGSSTLIDGAWARKDELLGLAANADVLYLDTELMLDARDSRLYLRTPTSIPGRTRTYLSFENLLTSCREGAVLLLDLQFIDYDTIEVAFVEAVSAFHGLVVWPARREGGGAETSVLARLWEAIVGGGGPPITLGGLREAISTLATCEHLALMHYMDPALSDVEWQPVGSASFWTDDTRFTSPSRGSREDAIQVLLSAASVPNGRERVDALSAMLRLMGTDDEESVRTAARRALVSSWSGDTVPSRLQLGPIDSTLFAELDFLEVPGAKYRIGSPKTERLGLEEERPVHQVEVPAFFLMRRPLTRKLANAIGLDVQGADDLPLTEVTWFECVEIAKQLTLHLRDEGILDTNAWVGLPSEVEWEAAAAGFDGLEYPWGSSFVIGNCNSKSAGIDHPVPPGRFSPAGDGPFGHVGLVGNVWEWTRSAWGTSTHYPDFRYPYQAEDGRESDDGPVLRRIVRGGAYYYDDECLRSRTRNHFLPATRHSGGGVRFALLNSQAKSGSC